MMLELFCNIAPAFGSPAGWWNYRDESFGSEMATMAFSRGGICRPDSLSAKLLKRFRADLEVG